MAHELYYESEDKPNQQLLLEILDTRKIEYFEKDVILLFIVEMRIHYLLKKFIKM